MNSLCPMYFKSTFLQRLIAVLCLELLNYARYTPNHAMYVCVFFLYIPGIFAESNTDVGRTIHAADQRLYVHDVHNGVHVLRNS